jgi:hypothetical protein
VETQFSAETWGERFAQLLAQVWHDTPSNANHKELFEPVA